jgi:hypothetical protein
MKRAFCICGAAAFAGLLACGDDDDTMPVKLDAGPDVSVTDSGPDGSLDAGPPQWRPVLQDLDGALLSIWGSSENDVWAVGGPLGNAGFDSLVVRFDGQVWQRAKPGKTDSFWWVHGSAPNDVWLAGEKGRITHWDGSAFTELTSGTSATLFGIWAFAPNDVWTVGGTPESPTAENAVVLHYDGSTWKKEDTGETKKIAFFKVWAPSKEDLYVVGEAGAIWHRVQGAWKSEGAGLATGRLTTIAGCSATEIYAVGGRDLLVSDGTTWKRADNIDPLFLVNDLNGVSCGKDGVVVVGSGSLKLRLAHGADGRPDPTKRWETDFGSEPLVDLHGAWADPTGAYWGVGGQFAAAARPNAKRQGAVARFAANAVSSVLLP